MVNQSWKKLCTYISTKCVESKPPDFQDTNTNKTIIANIYMKITHSLVVNIQDGTHIVQPKFNRFRAPL